MEKDPLVFQPREKWTDIQEEFKKVWPVGIGGYNVLKTQLEWERRGVVYEFNVYSPYGDIKGGIVALNVKETFYEVVIQCPTEDTNKLEKAIKGTKLVDWSKSQIVVPCAPPHVINMVERLAKHFGKKFKTIVTDRFTLDHDKPLYELSLPPGIEFKNITSEYAELMVEKWPHRYVGANKFFQILIKAKYAYGLFERGNLAVWMLISEMGFLTNLYTLENDRRKGYAELLVKIISNMLKRDDKDIYAFVVKGNVKSYNLFEKLGFDNTGYDAWCFILDNTDHSKCKM